MGAYSKDPRIRTLAAVERGIPRKEVVETFGVSLATLKRWLKKGRKGEDLQTRFSTGRERRILTTQEERHLPRTQLEENDTAALERRCELWEERQGVRVSGATMSRAIRERLG